MSESSIKLFLYAILALVFGTVMLVFGSIAGDLGNDTNPNENFPKGAGSSEFYTSAEGIAHSKWNTLPEAMVSAYYPSADDLKKRYVSNTELIAGFEISFKIGS